MGSGRALRSLQRIAAQDLRRLAKLAESDRRSFIARTGRHDLSRAYRCAALCQGAALHFLDHRNGVKDFDVWSFYAGSNRIFPPRRIVSVDFGHPKFGRSPDRQDFLGRRVDLLGRGIRFGGRSGDDLIDSLRDDLSRKQTASARQLAAKAVILVDPPHVRGAVVWPVPIEAMLDTLAACGIRRKRGVTVDDIVRANYGGPLEPDERPSYLELIGRLGFEHPAPPHRPLSDHVHYFDAECIHRSDAYTAVVRKMVRMARGRFPLRNIRSHVDFERSEGWLTFTLGRRCYRWPIKVYRDWMDESLLSRLARLFARHEKRLRFAALNLGGQDFLLGCATADELRRLQQRTGVTFTPLR